MKIVMLEEGAVNNNDISLDGFKEYGEFISHRLTPDDKIVETIGDAEVVLCNKCQLTAEVLKACPNLKYIGECATGYNNIDIAAAKDLGIVVTNAGQYSTMAVAQHVFAFPHIPSQRRLHPAHDDGRPFPSFHGKWHLSSRLYPQHKNIRNRRELP